jgi:hypothetical protein
MKGWIVLGFMFATMAHGESLEEYTDRLLAEQVAVRLSQKNPNAQTETISLSQGSTSFVDQTSPADFVGLGLNLAGVGPKDNANNSQAMAASVTLYALYAGALRKDPLDVDFYKTHSDLRRLSFTLGREDGLIDNPDLKSSATLFSAKVMLINKRDVVPLTQDKAQMDNLRNAAKLIGGVRSRLYSRILRFLEESFAVGLRGDELTKRRDEIQEDVSPFLEKLSQAELSQIDLQFDQEVEREVKARQAIATVYQVFKRKPQLSLEFQTAQRPDIEADKYRGQLLFDYGLLDRASATLNAGWEYTDVKRVGADLRGGRVAGELRLQLSGDAPLSLRNPVMFSLAGEGKWLSNMDTIYRVQGKLTLPLADGLDLPLSLGYASKQELLLESGAYGKFGLTLDFGKLLVALRSGR